MSHKVLFYVALAGFAYYWYQHYKTTGAFI